MSQVPVPQIHNQARHAIILAAGRGERMRPLTDSTPKPLLPVRGKPMIAHHIEGLAACGVRHIVINTAHLEEQFVPLLDDGSRFGVSIHYSHEGRDFGGALETLGGISRALPWLGNQFWVVAGDVFTDFWQATASAPWYLQAHEQARIALVPNPVHNPAGDFGLSSAGKALNLPKDGQTPLYTYSTIGLYRSTFFQAPWCDVPPGNPQGVKAALAPLLRQGMDGACVGAQLHTGDWTDVGTPERLAQLNA
jgi:N-acetyl-alpha-D-muramate 1-phosphate uridylyltransferase